MLLTRKKVVQVKLEATKGTAETTGFTDVLVFDPEIRPTAPFEPRRGSGNYLGNAVAGIVGERTGTFTCSAELRGNGTDGMDEGLAILLQGCGLKNSSETYAPSSDVSDHKSVTIRVYEDGICKTIYGAMGNVTLESASARRIICNFDFQGIWMSPADMALPAFSPGSEPPPLLIGATFTIGGTARKVSRFTIDLGASIKLREDMTTTSGIAHAEIVDYEPTFGCDLEAEQVAIYDINGIWLAGTEAALSIVVGSGAGKEITISAPKLQYREIPEGDRDGILIYDVTGQLNNNSGDDAISIAVATS